MHHLIVLLANRGGTFNVGDLLLRETLVGALSVRGRVLAQSDPQEQGNRLRPRSGELVALHLALLRATLRASLLGDEIATVVLPPGESVCKDALDLPRVLAQLAYLSLLRVFGIRLVVLGRGSTSGLLVNRLQEFILSKLSVLYTVRDESSVHAARTIGIKRVAWFPDLSWLSSRFELGARRPDGGRSVALAFRSDGDRIPVDALLDRIGELLEEAWRLGLREVILVQHDRKDDAITRRIATRFGEKYQMTCKRSVLSLDELGSIYGSAKVVMSNRLHPLIVGLQCGAVSLAVVDARETKVVRQLIDLQLADNIVDVATPLLGRPVADGLARRERIGEAVRVYRKKALVAADTLLDELFPVPEMAPEPNAQLR